MEKIKIKIFFGSENFINFYIEQSVTVLDLIQMVIEKFNIEIDVEYFSLIDVCFKKKTTETNLIHKDTIVCDILSSWYNEDQYYQNKKLTHRLYFQQIFFTNKNHIM